VQRDRFENSGSFRCEESMFRIYMPCLLLINILKQECIKRFGNRFRSTFNRVRYDITWSWCIGILEMEQEQPF
jgi:hypothetical protein